MPLKWEIFRDQKLVHIIAEGRVTLPEIESISTRWRWPTCCSTASCSTPPRPIRSTPTRT
jgi:hypothetical protein